ncbi:MAG: inositol 2-dehydrogenase [Deltaproteobacteria bacterium]|nr:inositol 2-dehydrogenase [Deltaproteobacteria bacterium]
MDKVETGQAPVGVGLIGVGRIGRIHGTNIANRIPGARLVGVCDLDQHAAKDFAQRAGGAKVYEHADALLADPQVDAVLICSATDTHADLVEKAAGAGRAIFCEKPISFDLAAVDRALAAVAQNDVLLQVGFNRRFDPSFSAVRRAVADGSVGTPELVRITSRDPSPPPIEYVKVSGGLFFDMTIHDFDMARFLTGSEPRTVFAMAGVRVDPAIGEAGDIDTAVITIEFENGVFCTIDNSRRAVYGYDQRVEVFGSLGVARAENELPHRASLADSRGVHEALPLHFFLERYEASFLAELESFVRCVATKTKPEVDGTCGRIPVLMARAAYASLAEGRAVSLEESLP